MGITTFSKGVKMLSEKKIRERIKELESDERHSYKPANVFSNAPLALIQTSSCRVKRVIFRVG